MSREIKFRVWCVDENEWEKDECLLRLDGVLLHPDRGMGCYIPLKETGHILEQFTGLKDKNGKEIYEGDIMKVKVDPLIRDGIGENTGVIQWAKYAAGFGLFEGKRRISAFRSPSGFGVSQIKELPDGRLNGEVIGNIHENPELIK